nr:hypothetical protein CFP56_33083 [Quercus suber]
MEAEIATLGRVGEGGPVLVKPAEGMTEGCAAGEALKNIDVETLQFVDGIKEGEALESSCVDVEAELQPFQGIQQILYSLSKLSPPINAPNDGGVNMETENSIPISFLEADLFEIQIRESDEALKTQSLVEPFAMLPVALPPPTSSLRLSNLFSRLVPLVLSSASFNFCLNRCLRPAKFGSCYFDCEGGAPCGPR